jgi:prepilin-type N-terminal cleavage/methylation domain-containing protein
MSTVEHVASTRQRLINAWSIRFLRAPHREAGLTLVEMSVVLAIIGLVMMSTWPLVQDVIQLSRAKGAAEQVAATMRLAREYAISTKATWAVNMTNTTIGVACSSGCPATLPPAEPTATIVNGGTLGNPNAVTDGDSNAITTAITFGSLGDATTARVVVVQSAGVSNQRVCVSAGGRIVQTGPGATCP